MRDDSSKIAVTRLSDQSTGQVRPNPMPQPHRACFSWWSQHFFNIPQTSTLIWKAVQYEPMCLVHEKFSKNISHWPVEYLEIGKGGKVFSHATHGVWEVWDSANYRFFRIHSLMKRGTQINDGCSSELVKVPHESAVFYSPAKKQINWKQR